MRALRIDPPPLALTGDLRWALGRAFGPRGEIVSPPSDAGAAVVLVRRLGLSARIALRTSGDWLAAELGIAGARSLAVDLLQTRGANRVLAQTQVQLAELLAELALDATWLKHAAMITAGIVHEGQREARDVDLLLTPAAAPVLQAALCARGFRPAGKRAPAYHLVSLVGPGGACVEVHYAIWGIHLDALAPPPTSLDFAQAGLTTPGAGSNRVRVPGRELLAANAIVHGLVQHLTSPDSYAPIRALADLVDLRLWELPRDSVHRLVSRHVDAATIDALSGLSKCLAQSVDLASLSTQAAPSARLLSHILAASGNRQYQGALRLHRLHELREAGELLAAAKRVLVSPFSNQHDKAYIRGTSVAERWGQARQLALGALEYARRRRRI